MECRWIRTGETDIAALREASERVAVLPLSSIESHGPHAPVGSDPLNLEVLLEMIEKEETVAILPQLPYSHDLHATRLHGAIHVQSAILLDLVENICDEIERNGFDKIVLLHGHGGNVTLHAMFVDRVLEKCKPYALYSIPPLPGMYDFMMEFMDTKQIGHGCEMETSMNLACCPECVHLEKIAGRIFEEQESPDLPNVNTPVEWTSRWPKMAVGDPSKATREKGEKIMAEWARRVIDLLRRIKRDQVVPRVMAEFTKEREEHRG